MSAQHNEWRGTPVACALAGGARRHAGTRLMRSLHASSCVLMRPHDASRLLLSSIRCAVRTLPEAETCELRSLTSGKVLGRVKISPEKGTPFEDRVGFNNDWCAPPHAHSRG